jgi:hypothetical protein
MQNDRVPPAMMPPVLVMWFAYFSAQRAKHGTKWCRRKGFGPVREYLTTLSQPPVIAAVVTKGTGWQTTDAVDFAKEAANTYCRICGMCELGRR